MRTERTMNRVGAVFALAVIVTVTTLSARAGWTPAELPGVLVWLDASDTGTLWADTNGTVVATNKVARWDDKSGNGNHMLQASSGAQPTTGTNRLLNGLNVLNFDGADDTMQETANAFGAVISNTFVFLVVEHDRAMGTAEGILELNASPAWRYATYSYDTDGMLVWAVNGYDNYGGVWRQIRHYTNSVPGAIDYQGRPILYGLYDCPGENVNEWWVDAVLAKSLPPPGATATSSGIKLAYGNEFDGAFAEVVILSGTVSNEIRLKMEGYLAWKWGMVGRLPGDHPYKLYEAGRPPAGTQLFGR
jgi:hypothetical protein